MSNSNKSLHSTGTRRPDDNNTSGGKVAGIALGAVSIAAVAAAGLYLVDLDQTQEARLPNVDVELTEGQLPEFDVDVADVSLESNQVEVEVPTMDVETETKTIEVEVPVDVDAGTTTQVIDVPTLSIERPEEDNPADNDVDDNTN